MLKKKGYVMQRTILSAFVAFLISAAMVPIALAYPTTARSGFTTVTGAYRPITLNLNTLVDGTDAFDYSDGFYFEVILTGRFLGEVY